MIYVTGDLHGDIDIWKLNTKNFPQGLTLTKDDYLIICGDFGLVWNSSKQEKYWQQWLSDKPWTTLFIDGNHENFQLLNSYPIINKFNGKVHKINDSIFHLMRGEIYIIENKKFFTFGGAESIDKYRRKEGKSWWKEEMPSHEEMDYGFKNLEKVNFKIDYIITHSCPSDVFSSVVINDKNITELERHLNFIKYWLDEKNIDYQWYFGHYHQDKRINDKFRVLYGDKIRIE